VRQPETDAQSSTNQISGDVIEIFSDHLVISNLTTRTPVYSGNVRVLHPQMYLTCERLTATVPEKGRINYILAETNVVVFATNKTDHIYASGNVLTYAYKATDLATNELIVLTGDARFKRGDDLDQRGDRITYDVITGVVTVDRPATVVLTSERLAPLTGTNAPSGTNTP
jgi:lipopolysaccharide transport protein LptA